MISKWAHLKLEAIKLRQGGSSLKSVTKSLGVPSSTLSGWFKDINLTEKQKHKLMKNRLHALEFARTKAVLAHNKNKENRIKEAEKQADTLLSAIDTEDKNIQELALAMLYLGEGFRHGLGIGNSNPLILRFFIHLLESNFDITRNSIRCELYLRADQNVEMIKKYWANELHIPIKNFSQASLDKRTLGSPTYPAYKGVCALRYGNVAIKRKLIHIAQKYCEEVLISKGG